MSNAVGGEALTNQCEGGGTAKRLRVSSKAHLVLLQFVQVEGGRVQASLEAKHGEHDRSPFAKLHHY